MVAYQPGKAAKVPAVATMSQTSLPSHTGAMVEMTALRPRSSRPTTPCSIPTPKSNPSRTRKPIHSTVSTRNQKATRVMPGLPRPLRVWAGRSVARFQVGDLRAVLGRGCLGQLAAGEARHQAPVDEREHAVEHEEGDQADHDRGGAHRRGDGVAGLLQALHDPRLAT